MFSFADIPEFQKYQDWDWDYNVQSFNVKTEIWEGLNLETDTKTDIWKDSMTRIRPRL